MCTFLAVRVHRNDNRKKFPEHLFELELPFINAVEY